MGARVAAVMTCHNRKAHTLACLESLRRQRGADTQVSVYLVDDGSTDGTGDAVRAAYPEVTVIAGDGSLLWAPGMRLALEHAHAGDYDHYLWLNDDTRLDDDAMAVLLDTEARLRASLDVPAIVVGSTRDPDTGALTYGGRQRASRWRRTRFALVPPSDVPVPTETMNGNIVLVPREVARLVGNPDGVFRHSWADEDYGLRARAAGSSVWLAPGTVGTCARNAAPVFGRRPLREELTSLWGMRLFFHGDWLAFTRRWAGPVWPLYWLAPYARHGARVLAAHAAARVRRGGV